MVDAGEEALLHEFGLELVVHGLVLGGLGDLGVDAPELLGVLSGAVEVGGGLVVDDGGLPDAELDDAERHHDDGAGGEEVGLLGGEALLALDLDGDEVDLDGALGGAAEGESDGLAEHVGDLGEALLVDAGRELDDLEGVEVLDGDAELLLEEDVAVVEDGAAAGEVHLDGLAAVLL